MIFPRRIDLCPGFAYQLDFCLQVPTGTVGEDGAVTTGRMESQAGTTTFNLDNVEARIMAGAAVHFRIPTIAAVTGPCKPDLVVPPTAMEGEPHFLHARSALHA
jgi:hypothetical protein